MKNITFNPDRHYIGSVCKHGHDWTGNGQGLRLIKSQGCAVCESLRWNKGRKTKQIYNQITQQVAPKIDVSKFYLGELCDRSHNYNDLGYSLRYQSSRGCVICGSITAKKYRTLNLKRYAALAKNYRARNPDKVKVYDKWYNRTEKGRTRRQNAQAKRYAKLAKCHSVKITSKEIEQRKAEFKYCCAYCGVKKPLSLDHFLSLDSGGTNTLSNLIPACGSCNSKKNNAHPKEWYKTQPHYCPKRWRKILKVLGKTESTLTQLPLF